MDQAEYLYDEVSENKILELGFNFEVNGLIY